MECPAWFPETCMYNVNLCIYCSTYLYHLAPLLLPHLQLPTLKWNHYLILVSDFFKLRCRLVS
jgi:hypothetical protein